MIDARSARPPFAFSLAAPSGWKPLRSAPEDLLDDLLTAATAQPWWDTAEERQRQAAAVLFSGVVAAVSTRPPLTTLVQDAAGPDDLAVITFSWLRTTPVLADLTLARIVVDGEDVPTGLGTGTNARTVSTAPAGGVDLFTSRTCAPLEGSTWLALLTGHASSPQAAEVVHEAVQNVAGSLTVQRG